MNPVGFSNGLFQSADLQPDAAVRKFRTVRQEGKELHILQAR